jgi:putative ABC transport system permease protein
LVALAVLWLAAAATAVAAVLIGAARNEGRLVVAGSTLFFLDGAAIGVPFVAAAARSVERWLPRLCGVEGRVAAASVTRAPERAGMTVASIAYVFAIAVTLAAIIESYVVAARDFVSDLQDGDLVVSAVATEGGWLEAPVGPEIAAAVAAVPGVARVEPARIVPGQHFRTGRVGILAVEPAALARLRPRLWREGDLARGRTALAAGEAVAVSTVFAAVHGVAVGDRIELESPTGAFTVPVVGLVNDMTSSSGSVLMSHVLYAEHWRDPTISRMNVYLDPGVGTDEAQRRIVAAIGDRRRLKIDALGQALAYIDGRIRDAFAFSRSLQLLIVIVAVAGIFDLLFARIFERRRELATWRVMGASEATVRRSVVVESFALGVLASILGLPVGGATAWLWVKHVIPSLVGYDIVMIVPVLSCLGTIALVLAATVVAGRAAATTASGAAILDGLRSD